MMIYAGNSQSTRGAAAGGRQRLPVRQAVALVAALVLAFAPMAWADRTRLKPGWNIFSPQQDVEIGSQNAKQAERQLPMLNDPKVDNYLNNLGRRLAAHAPGEKYPYQYKCVNDRAINAFALPGGFIYINRGAIEAADNEAQIAGVMAHETSHVALRHGTNQASKASISQLGLGVLGGMLGGGSVASLATQLGASFGVNSLLLKYSRTDESQADIMGTQILYDTGYDPRAMAQFFEKIQGETKGKQPAEFFSDHPNPDHRVERVDEEVDKLGGPPANYKTDSAEFRETKRYLLSLPAPPKARKQPAGSGGGSGGSSRGGQPDLPSGRLLNYENDMLRMSYPDNWQKNGQGNAVSFVPQGGVVDDGKGHAAMAYGMIVNLYEPRNDRITPLSVEEATDQLIESMRQSNPNMRVVRAHEGMRLSGEHALSTYLSNDSPLGGKETDWLVTILRPEGLMYFVCVTPENAPGDFDRAFHAMLDSVRFNRAAQ